MKVGKRTVMIISLLVVVMLISAVLAVFAFADANSTTDAMEEIEKIFRLTR